LVWTTTSCPKTEKDVYASLGPAATFAADLPLSELRVVGQVIDRALLHHDIVARSSDPLGQVRATPGLGAAGLRFTGREGRMCRKLQGACRPAMTDGW
jgi:hypothetical protein